MPTETLTDILKPILTKHEGRRAHVYLDSLGIPTVGIGFNLHRVDARDMLAACGADYHAVLSGIADLTDVQIDYLYQQCVIEVLEWLVKVFPDFNSFSINRQAGLVDMGFMGEGRFRQFVNMIAAIERDDWAAAATEALNSLWAKQVGRRSQDVAAMLVDG